MFLQIVKLVDLQYMMPTIYFFVPKSSMLTQMHTEKDSRPEQQSTSKVYAALILLLGVAGRRLSTAFHALILTN